MRIFWQSFVDKATGAAYLRRLKDYLNGIAAPGTQVEVSGISPPDRDFGRLAEFRCAIHAVDAGIGAEEAGYDAVVMGHFQDPGLYELRSALRIPVVGAGEATLHAASQLGRRLGLVTLDPAFEVWHYEQAELYGLGSRISGVSGMGCRPEDFNACFAGDIAAKNQLLADFTDCAMPLVTAGADVIVPAGVLPGLLIGGEPGFTVGHAPVVNCAAVALKSAEMWVQLRALSGLEPSRGPSFKLANERAKADFRQTAAHGLHSFNHTSNGADQQ
jgi:allantoin racemase